MKNTLIFFLLLTGIGLYAQTPAPYISADSIINKGIALYDEEKYDEALAWYSRVHPSDKLYALAMYEKALTYSAKGQLENAVSALDTVRRHKRCDLQYYNLLGSTLDDLGRNAEALAVFAEAYPKYKHTHLLPYNYAYTLYRGRKFDEAEAVLETSIRINPFHYNSHMTLGRINYAKGRLIPALLCFSFASNIAGNNQAIYDALTLFDQAINGELALTIEKETNGPVEEASATDEVTQQFAELDFSIRSNLSGNKNFKPVTKFDLTTTRQTQLIIENVKAKPGATDIYNQLYVPFFEQVQKTRYTEGYIYCMMRFSGNEDYQKIVKAKKNMAKLEKYISWAGKYIEKGRETLFDSSTKEVCTFNRAGIESRGAYTSPDRKAKTGRWIFYAGNGVRESEGEYTDNLLQGLWTYYNQDGNVLKTCNYKNDQEDGETVFYHTNGTLSEKSVFRNGKREDVAETFNESGNRDRRIGFRDGVYSGAYLSYFNNSKVKESTQYSDSEMNGPFESFFANGKPEVVAQFKADKPEGTYTAYYENGKQSRLLQYKNGEQCGRQQEWYADGTLHRDYVTDDEGQLTGFYKVYHANGVLSDSIPYTAGKENGLAYSFDVDGKLYYTVEYKDGVMQTQTQYDKAGKVSGTEDRSGKRENTLYYPNGVKLGSGIFSDGEKEGLWTMYDRSDIMEMKINFKEGKRDGEFCDYFGNGTVFERSFYNNGELDGPSIAYFSDGKLFREGYYKDGKPVGSWKTYYSNGKLAKEMYYGEDEQLNGAQAYYTYDGKKEHEEIYENGYFNEYRLYDAEGKLAGSSRLENGNGLLHLTHPDGKTRLTVKVLGGRYNDTLSIYNIKGKLTYRCNYIEGQPDGLGITYDDNGTKTSENTYILGKENGVSKTYNYWGKLASESEYVLDQLVRHTNYHSNGTKAAVYHYSDRQREGICPAYGDDGLLMYNLHYRGGVLTGYSWLDKSGKTVEKTFEKGAGDLVAWYPNGIKSIEVCYKDGWEDGPYTEWHSNGKTARTFHYVNGYIDGEYKSYSRTGVLLRHSMYKYNVPHGSSKLYHPNGKLAADENFQNGMLHGICKYYDVNGKLKYTRVYDNNRLLSETK